jgi:hypothetical protein
MTLPGSFSDFLDPAMVLLDAFDAWRQEAGASPAALRADHLGYQCGDSAEFEHLRALAERESTFIFQSPIARRRIVLARLAQGLRTALGVMNVLEIADQKPEGGKPRGFDHLEIYPVAAGLDEIARQLNGEFRDPRLPRLPQFAPSGRKHHPTYDAVILRRESHTDFKIRIEPEPLLAKIAREEFR